MRKAVICPAADGCQSAEVRLQRWSCTVDELEDGWNTHFRTRGDGRTLNLDFGQMGVAGETTWGDAGVPWAEHRLPVGGPALAYSCVLE